MLKEQNVRTGFFEPEQYASVLTHLPPEIQPIITFAFSTGWRIKSEVLPLQWRQVDFAAGEVRPDKGTTKNGDGRVFPMTRDLRTLLKAQHVEHERQKKTGVIVPQVFFREVAEGRGGEKRRARLLASQRHGKLRAAPQLAPVDCPMIYGAPPSVSSPGWHPRTRSHADDRTQDAQRFRPATTIVSDGDLATRPGDWTNGPRCWPRLRFSYDWPFEGDRALMRLSEFPS